MARRPTLESQLSDLKDLLHKMSDLVLSGINILVGHLENPTPDELIKLAVADTEIDNLETAIDEAILTLFATQQPMAFELRFAHACSKIASYLERMGDSVESLARQLTSQELDEHRDMILLMLRNTKDLFVRSYAAMFEDDVAQIKDINTLDDRVDELHREIYIIAKEMLFGDNNKKNVESALQLINVGSRLEKLADLACLWAHQIDFAKNGYRNREIEKKRHKVTLLDDCGGYAASVAASMLSSVVHNLVTVTVATRSAGQPVSILDHSKLLNETGIVPQVFPVAKMNSLKWHRTLLLIQIGDFSLSEEERDAIPHKTVQLQWNEIKCNSQNPNLNLVELKKRIHELSELIARAQPSVY